ncbi:hypothetical protein IMG5_076930 [Ichthyophthirius multifiliis]|uniref:Uncharacterized protein n=1 Tax=Ichthyophthirius multifiliis TaxID=5932 RepID=G0QQD0_ICHMU|nr:hypothetical protein IMG5_076930 [Ichthyophthirius multifiliis]EGR32573.1 hypothetical protein IMG5_076930 [Ichthyophthirius multifiliis]|eukprot:XP_004036559.1 hypothetical protein IMG5_076930 [Ichthyophthirius multifiliis]
MKFLILLKKDFLIYMQMVKNMCFLKKYLFLGKNQWKIISKCRIKQEFFIKKFAKKTFLRNKFKNQQINLKFFQKNSILLGLSLKKYMQKNQWQQRNKHVVMFKMLLIYQKNWKKQKTVRKRREKYSFRTIKNTQTYKKIFANRYVQ